MKTFILSALFFTTATAFAQPPAKSGGDSNAQAPAPQARVIDRTYSIAAAPMPAFKYELLPSVKDRKPGNAALAYMQAFALRPETPRDPAESKKLAEKMQAWEELPTEKLPKAELTEFLTPYRPLFRKLDEAARMAQYDSQEQTPGQDRIPQILSNLQNFREMMRLLSFRFRLEVIEGKTDEAFRSLQTMTQMAKHVGESGSAIGGMVGFAITSMTHERLETFLAMPEAPNLYWALASLPQPFIDQRMILDGERQFSLSFVPGLAEMEAGIVSEETANRALRDVPAYLGGANTSPDYKPSPLEAVGFSAMVALQGPAAKEDLAAKGWKKADLEKMPNAQAIILRAVSIHRDLWDDMHKLYYMPHPKSVVEGKKIMERVQKVRKLHSTDVMIMVLSNLYPAIEKVREGHTRITRRLALLQTSEAIRLHAAENGKKLPEKLADLTHTAPKDPVTDEPFIYKLTDTGYRLEAPAPAGQNPNPSNAIILNVRIRK
ncbi:MAG: hypothetical protein ACRC8S_19885 [Fimbriiglobus sp.]